MDNRIEFLFNRYFSGDTSFTEKNDFLTSLMGRAKYSQPEVRKIWQQGIKVGIETGLNAASTEGQMIELQENIQTEAQKEFFNKFNALCSEFNVGIRYHPLVGLQFFQLDNRLTQRMSVNTSF